MARNAPVIEHAGNTVTVIAPTAEEAMALVGDAGPGFRTTSIGKVRRGGLGGFFATEMVRVVAEASGDHHDATPGTGGSAPVARAGASSGSLQLATADDLIASLCGSDGPFAGRLAAGLQRSLEEPPLPRAPVAPADPAPAAIPHADIVADDVRHSEPPTADVTERSPQRRRTDSVGAWSAAALEAAGLPAALVHRVAAVHPDDEVTWNAALMLALRDRCGAEVPAGAVMSGPACAGLAAALHVPVVEPGDVAGCDGQVAAPAATAADLAAAGDRPVHLVAGGPWRHLATVRPALVSAASEDHLVDAVRAALAWDVQLGWVGQGDRAVRIDPFVVAAHVRALLAVDAPPPATPRAARPGATTGRSRDRREAAGR